MKVPSNIQKTALVAAVTLAISGIATLDNDFSFQVGLSSVVSSAYAGNGQGQGGGQKAMGGQKGGQSEERGQGGQHKGGKSISEVLAEDDGDEGGGKPDGTGSRGKQGDNSGKPGDTGSGKPGDAKGEDFGDIVIVQRNDDGTPTGLVMIYTVNEDGETVVSRAAEYTEDGELPALLEGEFFIPVEFGRMNVARSPESVIEHSLLEALSKLDGATSVELDEAGRLVYTNLDGTFTIDSPLENLALYEALLTAPVADDGSITLSITATGEGGPVEYDWTIPTDWDRLDLAASALAASSDKTGDLTIDEIVNISSFLGVDLSTLVAEYTYDSSRVDALQVVIMEPIPGTDPQQYVEKTVDLRDYVPFAAVDDSSIVNNLEGGIDEFADAANDAVQVLEFVHDNAVE